jgi:hypothetical protein
MVPSLGKGKGLSVRVATSLCENHLAVRSKENKAGETKLCRIGKWRKDEHLRACTWNVLSLYRLRALTILRALQEGRWKGSEAFEERECTAFCTYSNNKHQFRTGFVISKSVRYLVIGFKTVYERISCLRIEGKFFNCSLINIYGTTEEKCQDERKHLIHSLRKRMTHVQGMILRSYWEIWMPKLVKKTYTTQELGNIEYMITVIIMDKDLSILQHREERLLVVQSFLIRRYIKVHGRLQTDKL